MKHLMLRFTVLCLLTLSSSLPAEELRTEYNPFLAGTLSWYSAGLGQIYTENYTKGIIFFGIDTTLLILTINSVADFNLNVDQQFGINFSIKLKDRQAVNNNSLTAAFFLITYITFHFYNVFDAVASASKKNLGISMDLKPTGNALQMGLCRRF